MFSSGNAASVHRELEFVGEAKALRDIETKMF